MDASYTGNQIVRRRKELGLTQQGLAQRLHITDKAVSKWERGINFPDLGLIENLAAALNTTPAVLLGLEAASQEEAVSSMAQLYSGQSETTKKEMSRVGWSCLIVAFLLAQVYRWAADDRVRAYQMLMTLIPVLAVSGLVLLFRYGQIRSWNVGDLGCFYLVVGPVAIISLGYLFTDHGLGTLPNLILTLIAAGAAQLLSYRIMNGPIPKALPLILLPVYLIWLLSKGSNCAGTGLCAIVCLTVYLFCRRADTAAKPIPLTKVAATAAAVLLAFCLLFTDTLIQAYVHVFHHRLESYCEEFLETDTGITSRQYGPWTATVYPEAGMVEFITGGSGLVANSTYEGFYYSRDNSHTPYHDFQVPMEDWGDIANWSDGTDNHGTSQRIRENWFWYEASF